MNDLTSNLKIVTFTLDGEQITTEVGQTIWQAAAKSGTNIPHLCFKEGDGYRADGN